MQNKINFMIPHRVRICLYFTHTLTQKTLVEYLRVIAICDARTNRTKYKCKHKHRTNDEVSEFKVGETIAIIALSQHLIGSLTNTNITIAKWCDRYVAVQASASHQIIGRSRTNKSQNKFLNLPWNRQQMNSNIFYSFDTRTWRFYRFELFF